MTSRRELVDGWWHANDLEAAAEVLDAALAALGLAAVPRDLLQAVVDAVADEDDARRHQIGIAARHANAQLAASGRDERVRAFRDANDEPVWLVVTPAEHASSLTQLGAPERIERAYDDGTAPTPWTDPFPRREITNPSELWTFAQEKLRQRDYATALTAIERILASGYRADDVVLIELARISALRSASRRAEAIAAWEATAAAWLAGQRRVWMSQWQSLEKLHKELKLPETPALAEIRAKKQTAPR